VGVVNSKFNLLIVIKLIKIFCKALTLKSVGDRKFLKHYLLNALTMRNFESVKDKNFESVNFSKA
jgi:hypothetical protein